MPQPLRELVMHAGKQTCPHLLELFPFLRLEELVHYALEAALHIKHTLYALPDIGLSQRPAPTAWLQTRQAQAHLLARVIDRKAGVVVDLRRDKQPEQHAQQRHLAKAEARSSTCNEHWQGREGGREF